MSFPRRSVTIRGSAVPTIVWSSAARKRPSITATTICVRVRGSITIAGRAAAAIKCPPLGMSAHRTTGRCARFVNYDPKIASVRCIAFGEGLLTFRGWRRPYRDGQSGDQDREDGDVVCDVGEGLRT